MILPEGTILGGRYEIKERIGIGGMAVVYRGIDVKLDREVTIKTLKEEFSENEEFKQRFKIEARAAACLSHPNIVNVYDVGADEQTGIYFIVMEYVKGDTLKNVIAKKAPFDDMVTLSIAIQIASAISHAHKKNVIHRDIKPQNILMAVDGTIKVTDFGIARAATVSTFTKTSDTLGSVYYFSPEQARGGYVDQKSDIYSLGITMFEMVTGKLPFDADNPVTIALQHINQELPDISSFNPNTSRAMKGIIGKATRKKADERYANIDLMLADLKTALAETSRSKKVHKEQADQADHVVRPTEAKEEVLPPLPPKTEEKAPVMQEKEDTAPLQSQEPREETNESSMQEMEEMQYDLSKLPEEEMDDEKTQDLPQDGIRLELARPKREFELPESTVGFEKYSKKFKISKEDDFEETFVDPSGRKEVPKKKRKKKEPLTTQEQEEERKVVFAAVITSLILIGIISFFGYRLLSGRGILPTMTTEYTMPNFVGIPLEQAQVEAEKMGITLNVTQEVADTEYIDGVILSQTIDEGTSISKGDVVDITVSGTPEIEIEMPDLVYSTQDEAVEKIRNLVGATPKLEYEYDDTIPASVVIRQSPSEGEMISSTSNIVLTISRGSQTEKVVVPDVEGIDRDEAKAKIEAAGLVLGEEERIQSSSVAENIVISQSLTEGEEVDSETVIDLVISAGMPQTEPEETAQQPPQETTTQPDDNSSSQTTPPQTSSDTGTNQGTASGTRTFTIDTPSTYADENNISVKLLKITNGSTVEVVYDETKSINDFPLTVPLTGSGEAEVQLYIDDSYQWGQSVNFSEGGN